MAVQRKISDASLVASQETGVTHADWGVRYFSGTQGEIYFDDIFIEELTGFRYNVITNRSPIYGYASQLFDTVADGNLLVQGSFQVNFVDHNYVNIILQELRKTSRTATRDFALSVDMKKLTDDLASRDQYRVQQAVNSIRGLGNAEFKQLADRFNDYQNAGFDSLVSRFDQSGPFDIYVSFGGLSELPQGDQYATTRVIRQVYLTGQGQTITSSGMPVSEEYSFIGRDIA